MDSRPFCLVVLVASCFQFAEAADVPDSFDVRSPNGHIGLTVRLNAAGEPSFDVTFRDSRVLSGTLGLDFAESGPLRQKLKVAAVRRESRDQTYAISVGKTSAARDHHNQLIVSLQEADVPHRRIDVVFRAFDDGAVFRYVIPRQPAHSEFVLTDEHTRFSFAKEPTAHFLDLAAR